MVFFLKEVGTSNIYFIEQANFVLGLKKKKLITVNCRKVTYLLI